MAYSDISLQGVIGGNLQGAVSVIEDGVIQGPDCVVLVCTHGAAYMSKLGGGVNW